MAVGSGEDVGGNDSCVGTSLGGLLLLFPVDNITSGEDIRVGSELQSRFDFDEASVGEDISTKGGDELGVGARAGCLDLRETESTRVQYQCQLTMTYDEVSI